jgi:4-amino-4-deoxy-L-arabinose transferase-like glycosyltransferase
MELRGLGDAGLARSLKLVVSALGALTVLRLVMAAVVPLSPDECYYWVWSRDLQAGYLDGPPMVAWWIRAGTLIAGQGTLGVRLLGPLSAAVGSVLLYQAAEALLPGRNSGLWAAAALNATLLFGAGTVIMTPDTPLLFFWVCALWAVAMFARDRSPLWLILVPIFAGLAILSKYTAAFLVLGIGLWLVVVPELRRSLLRPAVWWGTLFGAQAIAPMVEWNGAHGWVSFAKQGGRVGDFAWGRAGRFLSELVVGQIGLATPLIFVLCVGGVGLAVRLAWRRCDPVWTLLVLLTVPPILLFVEHAFGDRVQANWPAIVYPAAVIAACGLEGRRWARLRAPAVVLGLAITGVVYLQAAAAVIPLPPRADPTALQLTGWREMAGQVEALVRQTGAGFVAGDQYGEAAEMARTLPGSTPVIAVGTRWQYFSLPPAAVEGRTGLLVQSERRESPVHQAPWSSVKMVGKVVRTRGNAVVERFRVYKVTARPSSVPMAVLPRPRRSVDLARVGALLAPPTSAGQYIVPAMKQ